MIKQRKLFCQISPTTYKISVMKCRMIRHLKNILSGEKFAQKREEQLLPVAIYDHRSLIRRTLGNVNMEFQENKAVNLSLAAPKLSHIMIYPGETFSFWKLVGKCDEKKGYKEGLMIASGAPTSGIGGGMCQMTNLIHWLVLHTPLTITEHHHHEQVDLFPDFGRQVPFGTGTSIQYNYVDYRFKNNTDAVYQLIIETTPEYLCGEIRSDKQQNIGYHIEAKNEYFSREGKEIYRNGEVYRRQIDKNTGKEITRELLKTNHARVLYDTANLEITSYRK